MEPLVLEAARALVGALAEGRRRRRGKEERHGVLGPLSGVKEPVAHEGTRERLTPLLVEAREGVVD